jgi:hypothetical protein
VAALAEVTPAPARINEALGAVCCCETPQISSRNRNNCNTHIPTHGSTTLYDYSAPTQIPNATHHIHHIMPPRKQKQLTSASASVSSDENMQIMAAPSAMVPTKTGEEQTHTPQRSPEKRSALGITEAQKQALMDNLQLEGKISQRGA